MNAKRQCLRDYKFVDYKETQNDDFLLSESEFSSSEEEEEEEGNNYKPTALLQTPPAQPGVCIDDTQLFVVPTGVIGANDNGLRIPSHIPCYDCRTLVGCKEWYQTAILETTKAVQGIEPIGLLIMSYLKDPHKDAPEYTWSFRKGLNRYFRYMRPGDVLLMSSSGTGLFNRVCMVKETLVLDQPAINELRDLDKSGRGGSQAGFPLMAIITKPVMIEWDKQETMVELGYTPRDRVQSARRIHPDRSGFALTLTRAISLFSLK